MKEVDIDLELEFICDKIFDIIMVLGDENGKPILSSDDGWRIARWLTVNGATFRGCYGGKEIDEDFLCASIDSFFN